MQFLLNTVKKKIGLLQFLLNTVKKIGLVQFLLNTVKKKSDRCSFC